MARPFDARELEARVEALLLRFQRSKDVGAVDRGRRSRRWRPARQRIVAVYSPKGGVGTTTIATNIAMAAGAQANPTGSCIVDLDLQFGQVATYLNLEPRQTLADVVRDDAALREAGAAPDVRDAPRQRPARAGRAASPRDSPSWSRPSTSARS